VHFPNQFYRSIGP